MLGEWIGRHKNSNTRPRPHRSVIRARYNSCIGVAYDAHVDIGTRVSVDVVLGTAKPADPIFRLYQVDARDAGCIHRSNGMAARRIGHTDVARQSHGALDGIPTHPGYPFN